MPRINSRIPRVKQIRGMGIDESEVQAELLVGIQCVYVVNGGADGTFPVHPHGYWVGGDISVNPFGQVVNQTLINAAGLDATSSGDKLLYTVTAGKILYMTSFYALIKASNNAIAIKDALTDTGTIKIAYNSGLAATMNPLAISQFVFPAPMQFNTGVMFTSDNVAGTDSVDWFFTGYEQQSITQTPVI